MNEEVQRLTIGIEEEFQIVDGDGQLKSHGETLIGAARPYLEERVKRRGALPIDGRHLKQRPRAM